MVGSVDMRAQARVHDSTRPPHLEGQSAPVNLTVLLRLLPVACVLALMAPDSSSAQQPDSGIPFVLVGAQRVAAPEGAGAWALQVTIRGGVTDQTREFAITSNGVLHPLPSGAVRTLSAATLSLLQGLVQSATPTEWKAASQLGVCSDCPATLLVLTRRGPDGLQEAYAAFWDATTAGRLPPDLVRIADLALAQSRAPG